MLSHHAISLHMLRFAAACIVVGDECATIVVHADRLALHTDRKRTGYCVESERAR